MNHPSHNLPSAVVHEDGQDLPKSDLPPGGVKLMESLKLLLEEKSFDSITTAEISRTASANEALIYRYFKDKRGLLHRVLAEYFREHLLEIEGDVGCAQGALNKLRALIKGTIAFHKRHRVFSKIMLLEVRNNPGYFESDAYELVRRHSELIVEILEEGGGTGEVRADLPLGCLRDLIIGGIEHACMKAVVFNRELDEESLSHNLSEAIISGLAGARAEFPPDETSAEHLKNGVDHGPQS
jgi:TetR/AcrR family transcriptional regulator, fatty acid metabolism regulator protein